jgi:hypothetical protein
VAGAERRRNEMATGTSLLLIAVGAVLAFAVNYQTSGVDIQTIGTILMVVGIVGLVFSLLFLASFAPFGSHETTVERRDYHDHV